MKRVLFYALIAVIAGGSLAAEPTWAQKRGSDESGRQKDGKSGGKRDKKGGQQGGKKSQKQSKRGQSKKSSPLQQITQAMQQELNMSEEQAGQIRKIIQEFKSTGNDGDREVSKSEREEMASRLRDLQQEAKKANRDGDRERARELMQEAHELMRGPKDSVDNVALDPKMFEAIAQVLDDKQRPKFRHIVERFSAKEKGDPGTRYLELLQGLNLSDDQGVEVARLYKQYNDDLKNVDRGDHKAVKKLQQDFQDAVMGQLTEQQQAGFEQALKKSKDKSRGGGKSGSQNRGAGGKGQKSGKAQKSDQGARAKSSDR